MPLYKIVYLDKEGKKKKKTLEAAKEQDIYNILKKNNQTLLSIEESKGFFDKIKNYFTKLQQTNLFGTTVDVTTIILFARQLGAMLGAGIPIIEALETLLKDQENVEFKEALQHIVDDISSGLSFSDAIAKYPKLFNNLFVNMIRSAEEAGGLDITLISISDYLEKIKDIKDRIKSATRYPLIVFSFVVVATATMVVFIVPKFKMIYTKLGADLPITTRFLMNFTDFVQSYFYLILIGVVGIFFLIKYLINNYYNVKYHYHRFLLKFPKLGNIYKMGLLINFSKTFGILLRSGINIIQALELSKNILNNSVYKESIKRVKDKIEAGNLIHNSFLEEGRLYPNIFIQMVGTGEETGSLDEMLIKFNDYFEREINKKIDNISSALEPFFIILIAGIILFITLSIYLPIFKLGQVMRNIS
ncbi:MAG: type II secretion system F family protein [Kosmotoga sp.]|nr:MAG: type II secretion system F family protein [Kosmotoga sp.]